MFCYLTYVIEEERTDIGAPEILAVKLTETSPLGGLKGFIHPRCAQLCGECHEPTPEMVGPCV